MAINYEDYGMTSPDEAVTERRKALDKYTNVAQPALQQQQREERGGLLSDVTGAVGQSAFKGMPATQTTNILGQVAQKASQMLPAQQAKQDAMNLQGAGMQMDVTAARQNQKVKNYVKTTEESKEKAADYLSRRAFEYGTDAKEMLLHQNGYVADRALEQMYKDLQLNRQTAGDIRQLQSQLALQAQGLKNQLDQDMAKLKYELKLDLANKDMQAAEARYKEIIDRVKEAAMAEAKAQGLAKIIGATANIGVTLATGSSDYGAAAGGVAQGAASIAR